MSEHGEAMALEVLCPGLTRMQVEFLAQLTRHDPKVLDPATVRRCRALRNPWVLMERMQGRETRWRLSVRGEKVVAEYRRKGWIA